MNHCIKTGAHVHFLEYDLTLPADLFEVGDCVVINANAGAFDYGHELNLKASHRVAVGSGFLHKEKGLCVVHRSQIEKVAS